MNEFIVVAFVERPQENIGVERIDRVVVFDEEGNEIQEYPNLAYQFDFFEPKPWDKIKRYVSEELRISESQVMVEEGI